MKVNAFKDQWNDNYSNPDYIYGEEPNVFLKQELEKLAPGKILFPAEGEGRNAVFAATKDWEAFAFDISEVGRKKAEKLAQNFDVEIKYAVEELSRLKYEDSFFDAAALIYAHFPPNIRSEYHHVITKTMKSGATLIFEGFSKKHLEYRERNPKVGGPGNIDFLFSKEELLKDFSNFDVILLEETEIELNEGLFHNGTGHVIRFVGKKN